MKKHKPFTIPNDSFFEEQEKAILGQTTELETWRLKGACRPEENSELHEAFWLNMEEAIRHKIKPKREAAFPKIALILKPVVAVLLLAIGIGIALRFTKSDTGDTNKQLAKQIAALDQQEILLYLTENPENLDLSQEIASQQLDEIEFKIQLKDVQISAEELLDQNMLNETDIENNL